MLDDITTAIQQYLNQKFLPWELLSWSAGSNGTMIVVFKGFAEDDFVRGFLDGDGTVVVNGKGFVSSYRFMKVMTEFGRRYPAFIIGGVIETESDSSTTVRCSYGSEIILDYADPKFFDCLDAIIEHIKNHDDLSGFSLRE